MTGHQIRVRPLWPVAGVAGAVLVAGDEGLASVDDDNELLVLRTALGRRR